MFPCFFWSIFLIIDRYINEMFLFNTTKEASLSQFHTNFVDLSSAPHFDVEMLSGSEHTHGQHEDSMVTLESNIHFLAQTFVFLTQREAAHAAATCRAFRIARMISDIRPVNRIAHLFGIQEIRFAPPSSGTFPLIPDTDAAPLMESLERINSTLPAQVRFTHSIRDRPLNPTALRSFFQNAYHCQMLKAFGREAHVGMSCSVITQSRGIYRWFATSHSTQFDADARGLFVLPKEIWQLTDLQTLRVSHNLLSELPAEIEKLITLQRLNVSYNRLLRFPRQIGALTVSSVVNHT